MEGQTALRYGHACWLLVLGAGCLLESTGEACSERERNALLLFKQEVVKTDPSGLLASWRNDSADCCFWHGVDCRRSASTTVAVTALLLDNCGAQFDPASNTDANAVHHTAFQGSLTSTALSALAVGLPRLTRLDLGCQLLHGSIPPEIGNLTSLSYLDLRFQAQPINGLGRSLSGILPLTLWSLPNLQYLDLGYNSLLGHLPDSISNATSLTALFLTTNNLSGPIPPSLANSSRLSHLDLSSNSQLTLLPSSPSWSPSFFLLSLDLSWCSFSGAFPSWLATQTNLSFLSLATNSFSGEIPSWAWSLVSDHLDLSDNTFSNHLDCSNTFKPSPSLTTFDISGNAFTGTMPCYLSNLTSISTLSLASNALTGSISSFTGNLTKLNFLDLSENKFQGNIPASMKHLRSLKTFYLDDNLLSGGVPAFMLQLPSLQLLDVSFNLLSGNVPNYYPSTTNPTSLTYLKFSYNNLTGSIPESLSKLTALEVLRLNSNGLTGVVPARISLFPKLQNLDLSVNNLKGPLPLAIGNMTSLVILIAGLNPGISGIFPVCVKQLRQLVVLDLRSTTLEGEIPEWVGKSLQQLQILILSNNLLTGKIPANLAQLTGMKQPGVGASAQVIAIHDEILDDDLNIITKGQTRDFFNLRIMAVLDLSENKLWGSIPRGLGELGGLYSLDLSGNSLNGSLPETLANLSKLESLDLSNNMLEGEIPEQFSDLTSLGFVNLSNNQLSGPIPDGGQWQTFNASVYANNKALCISTSASQLGTLANSSARLPLCSTLAHQQPAGSRSAPPPPQGGAGHQYFHGLALQEYISWTAVGVGYPLGVFLVFLSEFAWAHRTYWVRRLVARFRTTEPAVE